MIDAFGFLRGFLALVAVFALAALLSDAPVYRAIPPGTAVLKLSFTHGADRKAGCRKLSPEEIAALPPNMRRTEVCPRLRPSIDVELAVDGAVIYASTLPPSGFAGDGPSRVYEKFLLPDGDHEIAVRMRDNPNTAGFDHETVRKVALVPEQNLVIDYSASKGEFAFR